MGQTTPHFEHELRVMACFSTFIREHVESSPAIFTHRQIKVTRGSTEHIHTRLTSRTIAAVEKSMRLLQALAQIAAGTTTSVTDAKTWSMARGQFALGT
jgi:hypothetical protein